MEEIWIVCHGYGQLAAEFLAGFGALDDPHRLIVAPEALNRYYVATEPGFHGAQSQVAATWMTREERDAEIADYVEYLDLVAAEVLAGAPAARVVALGFSQGAATASRWAAMGRTKLHRLVLWGGSIASDLDPSRLAARVPAERTVIVVGARDKYISPEMISGERRRLSGLGYEPAILTFDGGHRLDDSTLSKIAS